MCHFSPPDPVWQGCGTWLDLQISKTVSHSLTGERTVPIIRVVRKPC